MILYHYCSSSTFFNIISNRSIWLSSLSASNDAKEGRWLSEILERAIKNRNLAPTLASGLKAHIDVLENIMDCLGFCLSQDGDMLSQWRGYADDASGFSIGFDKVWFESLVEATKGSGWPTRLHQVSYLPEEQDKLFEPALLQAIQAAPDNLVPPTLIGWDQSRFASYEEAKQNYIKQEKKVSDAVGKWFEFMYAVKNPAFNEEREWRLIKDLVRPHYGEASFRVRGNELVPYENVPIESKHWPSAIRKVFIGPKNRTPRSVVEGFLKNSGVGCQVVPSEATYR